MKKITLLLVGVLVASLSGCATQLQQKKMNATIENFKSGNLTKTEENINDAFSTKNALYYLEKGQVESLMGGARILQGTQDFMLADQYVQKWEVKASERIKSSLSDVSSYLLAEGLSSNYDLKNYEMGLLSRDIALNHLSQGNWNDAMVEAKKMAQREKIIEALIEWKVLALAENKKKDTNGMLAKGATDKIEDIGGYPVNLLNDTEANQLKNSYQNPATYYLSAFVYESQGETSLAAPGYRLAIELKPDVSFLKASLSGLELNIKNIGKTKGADTLFIIDTGFTPRLDSFRLNTTVNIGSGPKLITLALPIIQNSPDIFNPSFVQIDSQNINPELISSIDAMARRSLQDEMPGYLLRASTRAITSLIVQIAADEAAKKNRQINNDPNAALAGALAGLFTGVALQMANVADVRHWSTLPAQTYMSRLILPAGSRTLKYATPTGEIRSQNIKLIDGYNVVYLRMFHDGASVMTSNDAQANAEVVGVTPNNEPVIEKDKTLGNEGVFSRVKYFIKKEIN